MVSFILTVRQIILFKAVTHILEVKLLFHCGFRDRNFTWLLMKFCYFVFIIEPPEPGLFMLEVKFLFNFLPFIINNLAKTALFVENIISILFCKRQVNRYINNVELFF